MALMVDVAQEDARTVVRAEGEVDLYTSPQLRETLLEAMDKDAGDVFVDLSGVAYMDSSGVATLVEAFKLSQTLVVDFVLLNPSEPVRKVLQLSRLESIFTIEEEV